jgi:hypothetical protein
MSEGTTSPVGNGLESASPSEPGSDQEQRNSESSAPSEKAGSRIAEFDQAMLGAPDSVRKRLDREDIRHLIHEAITYGENMTAQQELIAEPPRGLNLAPSGLVVAGSAFVAYLLFGWLTVAGLILAIAALTHLTVFWGNLTGSDEPPAFWGALVLGQTEDLQQPAIAKELHKVSVQFLVAIVEAAFLFASVIVWITLILVGASTWRLMRLLELTQGTVLGIAVFILSLITVVVAHRVLVSMLEGMRSQLTPEIVIVNELVGIITLLCTTNPTRQERQRATEGLERSALAVEKGLLSGLRTRESSTDSWISDELRLTASFLRYLKRRLVLPTGSAWEGLVDAASRTIVACLTEQWGSLRDPTFDKALQVTTVDRTRRSLTSALPMFLSLVSFIVVLSLRLTKVLDVATAVPLLTLTGSLAAATILSFVDPKSGELLKNTKDIRDLIGTRKS